MKSYGVDGALCVLVSGPFANLSEDFNNEVDLISHEKAAAWLEKRKMNPCAARALFRQGLVQHLGLLLTRGWSQLIIDRFRDAVTNRPSSFETSGFSTAVLAYALALPRGSLGKQSINGLLFSQGQC